jgi:hypothetical protein
MATAQAADFLQFLPGGAGRHFSISTNGIGPAMELPCQAEKFFPDQDV